MKFPETGWRSVQVMAVLLVTHAVHARPPISLNAADHTQVSVTYLDFDESSLQSHVGAVDGTRSRVGAVYMATDNGWSAAFGHEYNALDVSLPGPQPQTNGHLHTIHLAGTWTKPFTLGDLRLALAPALSVSSNALKNPGDIDENSIQLWGSALWRVPGPRWDWVLGVAHDYRFGEGRIYGTAGLAWEGERVSLWATYPDVVLDWAISTRWMVSMSVQPDGNQWQAFDKTLERSSEFNRRGWRTEVRVDHRWRNGFGVGLVAGHLWDQRWRFDLSDGERLSADSEDNAYVGLSVTWIP